MDGAVAVTLIDKCLEILSKLPFVLQDYIQILIQSNCIDAKGSVFCHIVQILPFKCTPQAYLSLSLSLSTGGYRRWLESQKISKRLRNGIGSYAKTYGLGDCHVTDAWVGFGAS